MIKWKLRFPYQPSISMAHCSIVGVPWPISGNPEAHLQTKRNGHAEFRKAHILQEFLEMSGGYEPLFPLTPEWYTLVCQWVVQKADQLQFKHIEIHKCYESSLSRKALWNIHKIIEQTSLPFFPINQHVRHLNPLDTFDTVADLGCSPAPGQNGSALLRPGASRGDHRIFIGSTNVISMDYWSEYIIHTYYIEISSNIRVLFSWIMKNHSATYLGLSKPTLAAMVGSLAFLLSLPQQSLANPINPWLVALRKWYNLLIHIN